MKNIRRFVDLGFVKTCDELLLEKKKYIAREWVPTKAPELPEGWSALIEAEKAKKDIRSIVLPSHTNTNDDIVKR